MTRPTRLAIRAACVAACGLAVHATHAQPVNPTTRPVVPSQADFHERFGITVERSMFVRDRRGRSIAMTATPTSGPTTAPASPESQLVLLGVVEELDADRAYFEQRPGGTVVRHVVGDAIARGRIVAVELDAVCYESGGRQVWVEVGQDLTGGSATAGGPTAAAAPATSGPPLTGDAAAVAERMRQRRQQQLGR